MNLDDLRAAQVDERGTDSLQPLPATFYAQAADYLAELRAERDRLAERADDPFDSEAVRQRTDELETAAEVVEAVYDRRVGKLVKRASLAAAGMPADAAGLTEEEQALFGDLVERIEANRAAVLDALADGRSTGEPLERGSDGPPPEASSRGQEDDPDGPLDPAAAMGEGDGLATDRSPSGEGSDGPLEPNGGETDAGSPDDAEERVTVRVTADVGEIYGVDDRVYTLADEDVVTLPKANAKPLLDGGAARRVE